MGRKKRVKRKPKPVCHFIVEGETEENYLKCLKILYRKGAAITNNKGGNAKSVMNKANKIIKDDKDYYSAYIVWFDADAFKKADYSDKQVLEKIGAAIYISEPCIENWLLAHFETIKSKNRKCSEYETSLKKYISNYRKGANFSLNKFIGKTEVSTAINNYPEIGEMIKTYFGEINNILV